MYHGLATRCNPTEGSKHENQYHVDKPNIYIIVEGDEDVVNLYDPNIHI
jgi:hypothetical protein